MRTKEKCFGRRKKNRGKNVSILPKFYHVKVKERKKTFFFSVT